MLERRRFPRTKVFKAAKLIFADRPTINCVVRDLSNGGACLHVPSAADLPAEFQLSFDTGRVKRKCRIAWQTLTKAGVSFEQPTAARPGRFTQCASAAAWRQLESPRKPM
jgi:PilZ domain